MNFNNICPNASEVRWDENDVQDQRRLDVLEKDLVWKIDLLGSSNNCKIGEYQITRLALFLRKLADALSKLTWRLTSANETLQSENVANV